MAKPKVAEHVIKLQLPAGKATPAPPVGPALGQAGINIGEFCKKFNDKTSGEPGMIFPVVISVLKIKSYTLNINPSTCTVPIKKEAGPTKGSGVPTRD